MIGKGMSEIGRASWQGKSVDLGGRRIIKTKTKKKKKKKTTYTSTQRTAQPTMSKNPT